MQEYYWSLVLEPGWVQAAVWTIEADESNAKMVATGPPTHWEDDGLIDATDSALSATVQKLEPGTPEPEKTVFGVSPSWVQDGQIKPEHLDKIKRISAKLSLKPSGFVVLPEAIAHFMKSGEGTPLSAVVVGMGQQNIDISVFKLGNLLGSVTVARSVSIFDDVVEGLARFASGDPLPSRFLIYNGKEGELEEAKQALLSADWTDLDSKANTGGKLRFLHTPNIDVVSPDDKVAAVSLAGASEINKNVMSLVSQKGGVGDQPKKDEQEVPAAVSPEDVGFAVGADVAKDNPNMEGAEGQEMVGKKPKLSLPKLGFKLDVKRFFPSGGFAPPRILWVLVASPVVVLILLFAAWWFLPKATVIIYVAPQRLEESLTVFIDPKATAINFDKKTIPGKIIETSVTGDKTTSTTGTLTVGERAKGTVEIRNGTTSAVQLVAGAVLAGPNDLNFTLDSSASVSAKVSTTEPGTATVSVTASGFGAEYNLASGESMSVSNYLKEDVEAVVTSDLSGGSSREISAVAEVDRESLEESLTDELSEEATRELAAKVKGGNTFVREAVLATTSARKFSHDVGEETSTLKLSLALDVEGVQVFQKDLSELAQELLRDQLPEGFVLRDSQIETQFALESVDRGVWRINVDYSANLLPEIPIDEIAERIAGKYPPLAQDFLSSIPGYIRAEIRLRPRFPGRLGVLPRIVKNISVEVAAER